MWMAGQCPTPSRGRAIGLGLRARTEAKSPPRTDMNGFSGSGHAAAIPLTASRKVVDTLAAVWNSSPAGRAVRGGGRALLPSGWREKAAGRGADVPTRGPRKAAAACIALPLALSRRGAGRANCDGAVKLQPAVADALPAVTRCRGRCLRQLEAPSSHARGAAGRWPARELSARRPISLPTRRGPRDPRGKHESDEEGERGRRRARAEVSPSAPAARHVARIIGFAGPRKSSQPGSGCFACRFRPFLPTLMTVADLQPLVLDGDDSTGTLHPVLVVPSKETCDRPRAGRRRRTRPPFISF